MRKTIDYTSCEEMIDAAHELYLERKFIVDQIIFFCCHIIWLEKVIKNLVKINYFIRFYLLVT